MNRQYQYKVSLKNYNQLLRNLQIMSEDCFFLPHPVYRLSLFSEDQSLKNWLIKRRTIALPLYFMVLNFAYGIQLSIIGLHVSKYCLMPVTFYSSTVMVANCI